MPRLRASPPLGVLPGVASSEYLGKLEAARHLGVSPFTLNNWRRPKKRNPPKLPWGYAQGRVVYHIADLERLKREAAADLPGARIAA